MKLKKEIISVLLLICLTFQFAAAGASELYSDVPPDYKSYADIKLLTDLGIAEGVGDNIFAPEQNLNRADFMIMLSKAFNIEAAETKAFSDVQATDYFYDAVTKAAGVGIVNGKGNEKFEPYSDITMQEAIKTVIFAYEKMNNTIMQITEPKASKSKDLWAGTEIDKAITANIINEADFEAERKITRAEAAEILAGIVILGTNQTQYDYEKPTEIIQTQRGNIFLDTGITPEITVSTGYPIVEYIVNDFWNNCVMHGYLKVTDGYARLVLDNIDLGHYRVYIYGSDEEGVREELAKTTVSYLKEFEAAPAEKSPYGMNTHSTRAREGYYPDLVYEMSLIGVRHIRDEWYWTNVEPSKGNYTNPLKQLTDICSEYGIAVEPVSGFFHPSYDGGARPYTIDGQTGMANMHKAFFDMLPDRSLFNRMEMYNEWYNKNTLYGAPISENDLEYVKELYRVSYETVKKEYPDAILMGMTGGYSKELVNKPDDWTNKMFASGATDYIDELTIHCYPNLYFDENGKQSSPVEVYMDEGLQSMADSLEKYAGKTMGADLPWGVTESGFHVDFKDWTEDVQAISYPRFLTNYIHWGAKYIHTYEFLADGNDKNAKEQNFGIVNGLLHEWGSYTGRPAYVTYGVNARMIDDKKSTNKEIRDGIYAYDFSNGKESVKIFNTGIDEPKVIALLTDESLTVTDMMGESKIYSPHNGRVYITAGEDMTYVEGNVKSWEVCSGIVFNEKTIPVTGSEFILEADSSAISAEGLTYEVCGKEYTAEEIVMPASYYQGERTAHIYAKLNGEYIGEFEKRLNIDGRYTVSADFEFEIENGDYTPIMDLTVENKTDEEICIDSFVININNERMNIAVNKVLPVDGKITERVSLADCKMYQQYEISCRIVENGAMSKFDDVSETNTYAPLTRYTMTVDGYIDSEMNLPEIDFETMYNLWQNSEPLWSGAEDLSGKAWASYDDDKLYIAACVNDDVHVAEHKDRMIYSQDCLQLGLYHEKYEEALGFYNAAVTLDVSGYHEIGFFTPSNGGDSGMWRWATAKSMESADKWENIEYKITRDEKERTTVYEIAFPWTELEVTPAETDHFGIEIVVQDSDSGTRTNAYYLNGDAIHLTKNRLGILQYKIIK